MNSDKTIKVFLTCLYIIIIVMIFRHGISSIEPYYGYMDIPGIKSEFGPFKVPGADFSQVYFSAKALSHGESAYTPQSLGYKDRFGRLPNYPPYTNKLYVLVSSLEYPHALIIHNIFSILILLLSTAIAMARFGVPKYILPTIGIYFLLYFGTPLGLSHFERGQFDLFVAVSYLMMFCCMFERNQVIGLTYGAVSGLTGAIKWSSFPFLGTFGMLFPSTVRSQKWSVLLAFAIISLSIILYIPEIREYTISINKYELNAEPYGISYMFLMPKTLAKTFQLICAMSIISIGLLSTNNINRHKVFQAVSFPFALAMSIQGLCFGTISYEYRVVTFLALIPPLIIWIKNTDIVSYMYKYLLSLFFIFFLVIAFKLWDVYRYAPSFNSDFIRVDAFHTIAMLSLLSCLHIFWNNYIRNNKNLIET